MATEQWSEGSDQYTSEEHSKPSFLKKVKAKARAKAKQLKSKIKPGSTDSSSTGSGDQEGSPDQHGYDSSSECSSGDPQDDGVRRVDGVPYTALSNLVHTTGPATGKDSKLSEGSPIETLIHEVEANPAMYKSHGPPDLQQAVPTSYNYFNDDPETARLPSDHDVSQIDRDGTSALDSISSPTEKHEVSRDSSEERTGSEKQSPRNDALLSRSVEQDKGVGYSQSSSSFSSKVSEPPPSSEETMTAEFSPRDVPASPPDSKAAQFSVSDWSPRFVLTPSNSLQDLESGSPPPKARDSSALLEKARDAVKSPSLMARDSAHDLDDSSILPTKNPEEEQADESLLANVNSRPQTHLTNGELHNCISNGLRHAPAEDQNRSQNDLNSEEVETNSQNPSTMLASEGGQLSTKELDPTENPHTGESDPNLSTFDSSTAGTGSERISESLQAEEQESPKAGRNLDSYDDSSPQLAKIAVDGEHQQKPDSAGASVEETKPVVQRLSEFAMGMKDSVIHKFGYGEQTAPSDPTPTSTQEVMKEEPAVEPAVWRGGEDIHATGDGGAWSPTPFSEGAVAATEDGDVVRQKSVTEYLGSVPALLTTTLGFGGGTGNLKDSHDVKDTEDLKVSVPPVASSEPVDPPAGGNVSGPHPPTPGILDRMSGVASSIFGAGPRKPATETATVPSSPGS